MGLLLIVFGTLQLKHLSYPLLWQDEGETVMFGRRVLDFGYPKVGDGRNVVYGMGVPLDVAVREESDAYIGSLWGQYYFAALAVVLADASQDPHRRTALVRLPFVLAGTLGLLLLFLALAPSLGRRRGVLPVAIAYVALLSISTSLILHQREARYYPLVVLLLGAILFVQMRMIVPGLGTRTGNRRRLWGPLALTALLILLFNVFYPAAVTVVLWLVLEMARDGWRAGASPSKWLRRAAPIWIPLVATTLLCIPIALHFETLQLSRVMSERWAFGWAGYLANLGLVLQYLLRFEMLGLVLLAEMALFVMRTKDSLEGALRSTVGALLRLCVVWVLVGARNPVFFERYFVPLSPILILILVLDCTLLLDLARRAGEHTRRRLALGAAAAIVLTLGLRSSELQGRMVEIFVPNRGPVDLAIEELQQRFADPSALTIATNYEAEPYMFYLGSRVVGRFHTARADVDAAEAAVVPDVVIPRMLQPKRLAEVRRYLVRGGYQAVRLPIADRPYNNVPELFTGGVLTAPHLFRTPEPAEGMPPLIIYVRGS